jgi:hypothetical protein
MGSALPGRWNKLSSNSPSKSDSFNKLGLNNYSTSPMLSALKSHISSMLPDLIMHLDYISPSSSYESF